VSGAPKVVSVDEFPIPCLHLMSLIPSVPSVSHPKCSSPMPLPTHLQTAMMKFPFRISNTLLFNVIVVMMFIPYAFLLSSSPSPPCLYTELQRLAAAFLGMVNIDPLLLLLQAAAMVLHVRNGWPSCRGSASSVKRKKKVYMVKTSASSLKMTTTAV
jgi:hypothetical protein